MVFTEFKIHISVFWVVTPFSLVGGYLAYADDGGRIFSETLVITYQNMSL
jgi:hypothetical protein